MDDLRIRFGCLPVAIGVALVSIGHYADVELVRGVGWLIFAIGALVLALVLIGQR
jgi:hypothetical protein